MNLIYSSGFVEDDASLTGRRSAPRILVECISRVLVD
jgi:hypothetical protein